MCVYVFNRDKPFDFLLIKVVQSTSFICVEIRELSIVLDVAQKIILENANWFIQVAIFM